MPFAPFSLLDGDAGPTFPALITTADVVKAVPRLATLPDLQDLIYDVSAAIFNFVGTFFSLSAYTEIHDGTNQSRLWLRNLPVVSVDTVTVNGNPIDNTGGDAWTFSPKTGELRRGSGRQEAQFEAWFPVGLQNVVVAYTAGAGVPRDVRRAAILTVKYWADAVKASGIFSAETFGDYSYQQSAVPMMLPSIAQQILSKYVVDYIY